MTGINFILRTVGIIGTIWTIIRTNDDRDDFYDGDNLNDWSD